VAARYNADRPKHPKPPDFRRFQANKKTTHRYKTLYQWMVVILAESWGFDLPGVRASASPVRINKRATGTFISHNVANS
jgi:hypothetical protein